MIMKLQFQPFHRTVRVSEKQGEMLMVVWARFVEKGADKTWISKGGVYFIGRDFTAI